MSSGATDEIYGQVQKSVRAIRAWLGKHGGDCPASVGIVLGSGLGEFAEKLEGGSEELKRGNWITYHHIPHFPPSKVV